MRICARQPLIIFGATSTTFMLNCSSFTCDPICWMPQRIPDASLWFCMKIARSQPVFSLTLRCHANMGMPHIVAVKSMSHNGQASRGTQQLAALMCFLIVFVRSKNVQIKISWDLLFLLLFFYLIVFVFAFTFCRTTLFRFPHTAHTQMSTRCLCLSFAVAFSCTSLNPSCDK